VPPLDLKPDGNRTEKHNKDLKGYSLHYLEIDADAKNTICAYHDKDSLYANIPSL
jgi:hypothetical protein